MSKTLTVSIADKVYDHIIEESEGKNRSEFTEEIMRIGLYYHEKSKEINRGQKDKNDIY